MLPWNTPLLVTHIPYLLILYVHLLYYTLSYPSYFFFPLHSYFALHDFTKEKLFRVEIQTFPVLQKFPAQCWTGPFSDPYILHISATDIANTSSKFIHLNTLVYRKLPKAHAVLPQPEKVLVFQEIVHLFEHCIAISLSFPVFIHSEIWLLLTTTPHPIPLSLSCTHSSQFTHTMVLTLSAPWTSTPLSISHLNLSTPSLDDPAAWWTAVLPSWMQNKTNDRAFTVTITLFWKTCLPLQTKKTKPTLIFPLWTASLPSLILSLLLHVTLP